MVVDLNQSNKIMLSGLVTSIYEKENVQYVKIHYESGFVNIRLNTTQDIYLNDRVVINSKLNVESIEPQTEASEHL